MPTVHSTVCLRHLVSSPYHNSIKNLSMLSPVCLALSPNATMQHATCNAKLRFVVRGKKRRKEIIKVIIYSLIIYYIYYI